MNKIHEECGVFGVYSSEVKNLASMTYYALYALQHRGQDSCGIVVNDGGVFTGKKDLGLVGDVFTKEVLASFGPGKIAVGHVRAGIGAFLHHEAAARARADVSAAVPDEVLQFRRSLRLKIFLDGRRRTTGHNQQFDLVQSTRSYGIAVKQSKIHLRRCVHETEPFHTPIASRPCSRIHADLYRFRRNNNCR